jgi:hypothetical protein
VGAVDIVRAMAGNPTGGGTFGAKSQALRAHLDRWLFPAAPASRAGIGRAEAWVLAIALLALAVILQLLRVGPSNSFHSLWAEDGQIFLQEALNQNFFHAIVETYAGYLVLVPRLIGEVASVFPLRDAPAAVGIGSGIVIALSGLAVWVASAAHIRNPYLRGTLVALTVLAPVASLESVASAAYVPWYMLFASFWLLLWRPATMRGAAPGSLFILLTGLSSPGLWFFAPLAVLRAIAVKGRRDLMIVGAFAIGAAVQVPVIVLNSEEAVEPLWTSDIWTTYVQRVIDGGAFGERAGGSAWAHLGWPFLIALLVLLAVGLIIGAMRSTPSARYLAAIAIPTSLVMFVVSVYQRAVGTQMMWPAGNYLSAAGRYAIVPALLLASAALGLIDSSARRQPDQAWGRWVSAAAAMVLLAGIATSFDVSDSAIRGTPAWDDALTSAADACVTEQLSTATIATSPPGFGVQVPCDSIGSLSTAPRAR